MVPPTRSPRPVVQSALQYTIWYAFGASDAGTTKDDEAHRAALRSRPASSPRPRGIRAERHLEQFLAAGILHYRDSRSRWSIGFLARPEMARPPPSRAGPGTHSQQASPCRPPNRCRAPERASYRPRARVSRKSTTTTETQDTITRHTRVAIRPMPRTPQVLTCRTQTSRVGLRDRRRPAQICRPAHRAPPQTAVLSAHVAILAGGDGR